MSQTPTVYFIDDSATMREVIKIAFRRENINVVACTDGNSAIAEMVKTRPDVVISDVIMPDKDGYEVCQQIKQTPEMAGVPVILMSGVVNRAVAEKAFAVKADELIRKPFQPQDLITRVRHLLGKNGGSAPPVAAPQVPAAAANAALSGIFAAARGSNGHSAPRPAASTATAVAAPPEVTAAPARPAAAAVPAAASHGGSTRPPMPQRPGTAPASTVASLPADVQRLKIEVLRLEHLVKKLQSELEAEREYSQALEEHVKTLQEAE